MKPELYALFQQYQGNLPFRIAKKHGVHSTTLKRLLEKGEIEQPYRGTYVLPEAFVDRFFVLQQKFTKGIYSYETALFLHDLTDLNIGELDMTFPTRYNRKNLENDYPITPHVTLEKWYNLGIEEVKSPIGNPISVYDRERTICDMWSKHYRPDIFIRNEALKRYLSSKEKDARKLRKYMRILDVSEDLSKALEVLL